MVTCSELPSPQLTISKVAKDKKSMQVIARASAELTEESESGYTCLAQNPIELEKFCSSSSLIDDAETGIALWEISPQKWADGGAEFSTRVGAKR